MQTSRNHPFIVSRFGSHVRSVSMVLALLLISSTFANAQTSASSQTGLPLPRFVSLKSSKVNMRIGPGKQFKVAWMYLKKGLPIEIIQEYENWRKVRDQDGNEGWILHSLLSGKRTAVINPWEEDKVKGVARLHSSAETGSDVIARMEPGVIANVETCMKDWCQISIDDTKGYLEKKSLWGVYPDELIE